MSLDRPRIWQGGAAGGMVWIAWSLVVNMLVIGRGRYEAMRSEGLFLQRGRYPAFEVQWILMLFILAIVLAHLYAWLRSTLGPGPKTALKIGALVGFASGFPPTSAPPLGRSFHASSRWAGCWSCGWALFWRRWSLAGYTGTVTLRSVGLPTRCSQRTCTKRPAEPRWLPWTPVPARERARHVTRGAFFFGKPCRGYQSVASCILACGARSGRSASCGRLRLGCRSGPSKAARVPGVWRQPATEHCGYACESRRHDATDADATSPGLGPVLQQLPSRCAQWNARPAVLRTYSRLH